MRVSLEEAYREACIALGEGLVRERILTQQLNRAQKELERLVGAASDEGDGAGTAPLTESE